MRQRVLVIVPPLASLFELATPLGIWGRDFTELGGPSFDLTIAGLQSDTASLGVPAGLELSGLELLADHSADNFDSVIVPTWPVEELEVPDLLTNALRQAHSRGSRIVGLCLGAFALAASGLLDGRRAVTHWTRGSLFETSFPDVIFDPSPLYIDHGRVVTSAGSAAALDCCLHLVREDHGTRAAAIVARGLVTAPHRAGGQAQFADVAPIGRPEDDFGERIATAVANISDLRSVEDLATLVATSRRSLERVFRSRLGMTPARWLTEQRLSASRQLLEETRLSIEQIAHKVGFGSAPTFRREFKNRNGVPPAAYRRTFQGTHPT